MAEQLRSDNLARYPGLEDIALDRVLPAGWKLDGTQALALAMRDLYFNPGAVVVDGRVDGLDAFAMDLDDLEYSDFFGQTTGGHRMAVTYRFPEGKAAAFINLRAIVEETKLQVERTLRVGQEPTLEDFIALWRIHIMPGHEVGHRKEPGRDEIPFVSKDDARRFQRAGKGGAFGLPTDYLPHRRSADQEGKRALEGILAAEGNENWDPFFAFYWVLSGIYASGPESTLGTDRLIGLMADELGYEFRGDHAAFEEHVFNSARQQGKAVWNRKILTTAQAIRDKHGMEPFDDTTGTSFSQLVFEYVGQKFYGVTYHFDLPAAVRELSRRDELGRQTGHTRVNEIALQKALRQALGSSDRRNSRDVTRARGLLRGLSAEYDLRWPGDAFFDLYFQKLGTEGIIDLGVFLAHGYDPPQDRNFLRMNEH